MNWAWITGYLTEHEMKEEHGLELEILKAQERGERKESREREVASKVKGLPLPWPKQERRLSIRGIFDSVIDFNESMKNWKGR